MHEQQGTFTCSFLLLLGINSKMTLRVVGIHRQARRCFSSTVNGFDQTFFLKELKSDLKEVLIAQDARLAASQAAQEARLATSQAALKIELTDFMVAQETRLAASQAAQDARLARNLEKNHEMIRREFSNSQYKVTAMVVASLVTIGTVAYGFAEWLGVSLVLPWKNDKKRSQN